MSPTPKKSSIHHTAPRQQRGAVLMIMLVILIIGTIGLLANTLNSSATRIERDKKSADVLAQAKEALIARAVTDATSPGSLPCPDLTGLGSAEVATDCSFYIGRLPWKTLGLPDLRDSNGEPLWYALSRNFRDDNANNPINSDSLGDLTLSGTPSANQVIAIVFAPGASISGKRRSNNQTANCITTGTVLTENLCAENYLEGTNASLNSKTTLNKSFNAGNVSSTFNDQIIYITRDNLLPPVERRIAREVKQCLDDYAVVSASKYPWAVPLTEKTNFLTATNTLFGRIPTQPTTYSITSNSTRVNDMLTKLAALQTAVNNCAIASNNNNSNVLDNAGNALKDSAETLKNNQPTTPLISSNITDPAKNAGDKAQSNNKCSDIYSNSISNDVQIKLNATYSALKSSFPEDSGMSTTWPLSCTPLPTDPAAFAQTYWNTWRNFVFYRVTDAYRPNGTKSCGTSCLSIIGSGNDGLGSGSYRATVFVASKNLKSAARTSTSTADYLEGANVTASSTTTFETYKPEEQTSKGINDIVLCLDGKGLDANSKCN
jgi:hypothetical protein